MHNCSSEPARLGTALEFYSRVTSLLHPDDVVLDFGAGRGRFLTGDKVEHRRRLRTISGKVRHVVGADVSDAIRHHPALDSKIIIAERGPIPLRDSSVDLILADWVFEHIAYPEQVTKELARVLRPGGWICARTPNKWGYVGIAASIVPNRFHPTVVKLMGGRRHDRDVFPTHYKLNTKKALLSHFPPAQFDHHTQAYQASVLPYLRRLGPVSSFVQSRLSKLPEGFRQVLLIFIQKQ